MAFAHALHRGIAMTPRGRTGPALLALGGLGLILAGLFPWTMVNGVPAEPASHMVGAVMTFTATGLGLTTFSSRLHADSRWRNLAGYSRDSGLAILVLFVALGFFAVDDGTPLHPWAGLIQRILAAVWFAYTIVLAVRLRNLSGSTDQSSSARRRARTRHGPLWARS